MQIGTVAFLRIFSFRGAGSAAERAAKYYFAPQSNRRARRGARPADHRLRAEATGADPRMVQAEINRRMAAALAATKPVAAVKAASGNYQTYQVTPTGPDGKPKPPAQWHTVQDLILVSRDFGAALALAGQLQAGGMLIGEMHFDVAPETLRAQQQALTDEALTAMTARAGQIAATLGLTVARIQTLNVGNAMQPGGGPRPLVMARAAPAPAPPPAVAAGDTTIAVTVNAEIALTPK